jgi:predicted nuclease of restriction endonuclease-like (RecB) superfamily
MNRLEKIQGYDEFLKSLKERIKTTQVRAALSVNRELLHLYWCIGRDILERQNDLGWGANVIDRIAHDLKAAFPDQKGFSPRSLKYMRKFAELWPDDEFVQQPIAQLPWGHHITLMEIKSREDRLWYAQAAIEHGWSRNVLIHQIDSGLKQRHGQAATNFQVALPSPQSDLAQQVLKDPYCFDFLTLGKDAKERELEQALIENLRDFLLELGAGFAFVGRQHRLEVAGDDFYTDLLFYHLKLHCYVVIDLKMDVFKPEYAGKMQFYVAVVDDKLRDKNIDGPTIGLILCRAKKYEIVEYALQGSTMPVGISTYELSKPVKEALAVEEIKHHLSELEVARSSNVVEDD